MMISTIQKGGLKNKENKNQFIPFENERDNIGRIIQPKKNRSNTFNIMCLFENLKKSTKEYFFDKEFEKKEKKFKHLKKSLEGSYGDKQIQLQIDTCFQIVNKLLAIRNQGRKQDQNLYINLREEIEQKMSNVKRGLKKIKDQRKDDRQWINNKLEYEQKDINVDLFKSFSARSGLMANFCKSGLKYKSLVEKKRFNPWKSWYKTTNYELFPGKNIKVKCLQKSIYD